MDILFYIQAIVNICGCVLCALATYKKRASGDAITILSIVAICALFVQGIVFAVLPAFGIAFPRNDPLELGLYYIFALLMCIVGFVWTLINRTTSSVVLMGFIFLALVVMHYRMRVLWG